MKKMMIRISSLLLVMGALAPVAFGAGIDSRLERDMVRAGFDEQQVARVLAMIQTAEQQGLPVEAVSAKVREGIAKRVSARRITVAAERVVERYSVAYGLAGQQVDDPRLAAELGRTIAAAMAAGMTRQDAEAVADSLAAAADNMTDREHAELTAQAWFMARDMARRGVTSSTTAEVVRQTVRRGYRAGGIREMRDTFNNLRAMEDADAVARGVAAGGMGEAGETGSMGRGGTGSMGGSGPGGGGSGGGGSGGGGSGGGGSGGGGSGGGGSGTK